MHDPIACPGALRARLASFCRKLPGRSARLSIRLGLLAAMAGCAVACAEEMSLPSTPDEARQFERQDALALSAFYDTPGTLAITGPGRLLRSELAGDYVLPPSATAVRILYHSLDASGRDVATSGVVLIPSGKAPAGGWPVIAWAHGTSGVARQCAPSAMKDVYYGEEGLYDFLKAGFAVVATDYHGLGTEGPHQYINKLAQAQDVVYSLAAAREAVRDLGPRWVVDGHSQGGLAAWGVAELEARLKDSNYLGAVSVAGAVSMPQLLANTNGSSVARFYAAFMAFGLQARNPGLRPDEVLTDQEMRHYEAVTREGCWYYGYASYLKEPKYAAFQPGLAELPAMKRFVEENSVGRAPIAGPVLVIAGEGDQSVPIDAVRAAVGTACKARLPVTFRSYPGLDHDPVMINSTPDQIAWIRARFAGEPAGDNCTAQTAAGHG